LNLDIPLRIDLVFEKSFCHPSGGCHLETLNFDRELLKDSRNFDFMFENISAYPEGECYRLITKNAEFCGNYPLVRELFLGDLIDINQLKGYLYQINHDDKLIHVGNSGVSWMNILDCWDYKIGSCSFCNKIHYSPNDSYKCNSRRIYHETFFEGVYFDKGNKTNHMIRESCRRKALTSGNPEILFALNEDRDYHGLRTLSLEEFMSYSKDNEEPEIKPLLIKKERKYKAIRISNGERISLIDEIE